MIIKKIKISELIIPERNVRIHPKRQIEEYARSLQMFGQTKNAVIDEDNCVLIGNGLIQAAKSLGWEEIYVVIKAGLSENQKKKLMIADNKIFNLGIEDLETTNAFLEELLGDLDVPGYDEDTLKTLVGEAQDVTDAISTYGTIDNVEITRIQNNSQRKENLIHKADNETHYEQVETEPSLEQTNTTSIDTSNTRLNDSLAERIKDFVVCPKCGEKIWL